VALRPATADHEAPLRSRKTFLGVEDKSAHPKRPIAASTSLPRTGTDHFRSGGGAATQLQQSMEHPPSASRKRSWSLHLETHEEYQALFLARYELTASREILDGSCGETPYRTPLSGAPSGSRRRAWPQLVLTRSRRIMARAATTDRGRTACDRG
jgi:hypothetical protein